MEAQMHRSYGAPEEHTQHSGPSEGLEHHEKKSVLKKVKAKAKKIKHSLKHLGHEHDEHGHEHHDDQEDEEYDDEEMEDDPEVHGAPIYESSAIRSGVVPRQDVGMAPKSVGNLQHPSSRTEGGLDSNMKNEDNMRRFLRTVGEGRDTSVEADHIPAEHGGLERTEREPGARFGVLAGLQHHHQSPMDKPENLSNYQSNLTHPLTSPRVEEAEGPPLVTSIGKMTIEDRTIPNSRRGDSLNSNLTTQEYSNVPPAYHAHHGEHERTERAPGAKFGVLTGLQQDPQAPMDKPNPSNYQSKLTDPTGHGPKEAGVPSLVASFGKMTVEDDRKPYSTGSEAERKTSHTGSHDQFSREEIPTSTLFNPETTPKQFHSNQPEEEMPRDIIGGQGTSSYTDKISSAASAIADKATTAKNVVASKLGYGGVQEEGTHTSTPDSTATGSPTEYAHKAAAAVTGTLAPIYGKVAGAGNAMASKIQGMATGEDGIDESSVKENKGRGVAMKEYLAEKLKPGEEDKALSKVITDTLHLQKEKTTTGEAGETGGRKPIERVTESEEVARRLGSGQENKREGHDAFISGSQSSGNTVVDKIKDAVTTWVMKGGESPTSHQGSPADTSGNVEAFKNQLHGHNK